MKQSDDLSKRDRARARAQDNADVAGDHLTAVRGRRQAGAAVLITLLCLASLSSQAALRVGSWNMKHLGWNNHKNLDAAAQIIARFDLVGLQEVMHPHQLQPLVNALESETDHEWGVTSSKTVGGSSYREGYAFVWRKDEVHHAGSDTLYVDRDHDFLRRPFSARFQSTDGAERAFVAATIHIQYGDSRSDRTPEIRALADYWHWLGRQFDDQPRILMGDFNLGIQGNKSWRPISQAAKPYVIRQRTTLSKAAGQFAHAYDHFWVTPSMTVTSAGRLNMPRLLGISHKTATQYVSDHAAIYLTLGNTQVDTSPVSDPAISDGSGPRSKQTESSCIDLNKARLNRLSRIVHIGPSRAKAIQAGRDWHDLANLTQINGISDNRLSDIRNQSLVCDLH